MKWPSKPHRPIVSTRFTTISSLKIESSWSTTISSPTNPPEDEAQLRALSDHLVLAMRSKNAAAVASHYGTDLLTFDIAPPLQSRGGTDFAKNTTAWFDTWLGPIAYEIQGFEVSIGGDVAFGHALVHISGSQVDGEKPDIWLRITQGYRKIQGTWLIVHEHTSVPFYMEPPFKAARDLKP